MCLSLDALGSRLKFPFLLNLPAFSEGDWQGGNSSFILHHVAQWGKKGFMEWKKNSLKLKS